MPRCAREKIENGIYHICIRGNNKQDIFLDDKDREEYLARLRHYKERYKVKIYAYCLMTNHVHLLIYDNAQDISKFMQGLSLSYVIYFNHRYGRVGHLFQDRFTSVLIKDDKQILCASKYIHCNPIKANMVTKLDKYRWSSYMAYLQGEDQLSIVDIEFLCQLSSQNQEAGRKAYIQYVNQSDENDNNEVASTKDVVGNKSFILKGIKRLAYKEIYNVLYRKWKQGKSKKVASKYYFQRDEANIYLLGLISRLSGVQLAKKLRISVSSIYKNTKLVVDKMVKNNLFCQEIDKIVIDL
ncbi:MAG: transposase [Cellulosilyticum sp.]|nr:transposase [Cellulosilyticum sp.]